MAHPKPGDVILDPMCGGGSISIEVCIILYIITMLYLFVFPRVFMVTLAHSIYVEIFTI